MLYEVENHGDPTIKYYSYNQILIIHVFQGSCSRVTTSNLHDQGPTSSSGTATLDAESGHNLPKVYLLQLAIG